METKIFSVQGMTCAHCEKAISKALTILEGVASVKVSLSGKTVTVQYYPSKVTPEVLKNAIEDQGYDVA